METVACALCGGEHTSLVFKKWDFAIVRCLNCGLCFVNPRVFAVEADDYFSGPYLTAMEENQQVLPGIESLYAGILEHLNAYLVPGRLLDVGCGMGHFMAQARQSGWNCHGVECSQFAAEYGRRRWDLRIQPVCDLREARLPDNHFDACVLIESIEHLPQPQITLTEVFKLLKPGGMLYLTAPNFASFRALLEREEWKAVIPTGHLYYFTGESLGRMLRSVGFERLVNMTPPAILETEVEAIRSEHKNPVPGSVIDAVRSQCEADDARKLVNGRSESLAMVAFKPRKRFGEIEASLRFNKVAPVLEGRLVAASGDTPEAQKVYLINEGRKHWVTSVDWLTSRGLSLEQTLQVDADLLRTILPGPALM